MPEDAPESLGWWTIHGSTLLTALHEVAKGSHPDVVYAEMYANAEVKTYSDDDEDD